MNFIFNNSNQRPFLYSKDNIIYKTNDSFLDLTGYCHDEIIGKSLFQLMELFKCEDLPYSEIKDPMKSRIILTKAKIEKEVTISYESLMDENEIIIFIEECQFLEFDTILNNISDEIIYFNNKGEPLYKNKAAYEKKSIHNDCCILNCSQSIIEGFQVIDMDGSPIPIENRPMSRILGGENLNNFIFCLISNDNIIYYEINGNPIYDSLNKIIGGVMIRRDISHRFKIEEYLMFINNTNSLTFNYASLSYPDFKIIYINEQGYKTINNVYENIDNASSMIGSNFFNYFQLDHDEKEEILSNISNSIIKKPYTYIYNHKHILTEKDNFVKIIFQPILDINKNIETIIAFGIDISDEIREKKALAQSLKAQEEMFLNISHDLKTPLNMVISASQLLRMNLLNLEQSDNKNLIQRNANLITQNSYRLSKLINNILDISKLESGFSRLNLQNINIIQLVEDIVSSISEYIKENKLKIIFDTNIEEKIIACDPCKIERAILNLISNAIKFSNLDGIILINIFDKGEIIEISVADEGIGIDEKNLDLIFEKFNQVKESLKSNSGGTGIGLSLVKSLVELHNGRISLESELGRGSTFKIQLPVITVENPINQDDICPSNIIESIKFEFSDIYSLN